GIARPDLVSVDDEVVAITSRSGAQRREIGAGVGLAEALAPPVTPADDPRKEPVLDLVGSVHGDALHEVAEAGPRRSARRRELLVQDHVEDGREIVAAVALRPAQPEEPGVEGGGRPVRLARPIGALGPGRRAAGGGGAP